jgi:hypothetical protein
VEVLNSALRTDNTVERVALFQEASRENGGKALDMSTIHAKITEYVAIA